MGQPILVGHSMGGLVSIVAASVFGDELAGAVIVDAPVRRPDPESQEGTVGTSFKNPKTYATAEDAIVRFRLACCWRRRGMRVSSKPDLIGSDDVFSTQGMLRDLAHRAVMS